MTEIIIKNKELIMTRLFVVFEFVKQIRVRFYCYDYNSDQIGCYIKYDFECASYSIDSNI